MTHFGKSLIWITQGVDSQTFELPNGVEIKVPDEVASSEGFDSDPPSASACYVWLSSVVVRSRIGHENLGKRR